MHLNIDTIMIQNCCAITTRTLVKTDLMASINKVVAK